jgi:excinuclease UvrABC ATPase subunit
MHKARLAGTKLYLIEEPSIGLHMQDVRELLEVLHLQAP